MTDEQMNGLPIIATTAAQRKLVEKHGSPRRFARSCYRALGEISVFEADNAIEKYRREWEGAK